MNEPGLGLLRSQELGQVTGHQRLLYVSVGLLSHIFLVLSQSHTVYRFEYFGHKQALVRPNWSQNRWKNSGRFEKKISAERLREKEPPQFSRGLMLIFS